jgi:hypothetical protein
MRKFGFAKASKRLPGAPAGLAVARADRTGDISHSLSTAFRIPIAFFS